jgi:hypothetical protein
MYIYVTTGDPSKLKTTIMEEQAMSALRASTSHISRIDDTVFEGSQSFKQDERLFSSSDMIAFG